MECMAPSRNKSQKQTKLNNDYNQSLRMDTTLISEGECTCF